MGEIIEKIGGWFDYYIFRPICKLIVLIVIALAVACVPIAAVKYLFFS